MPQPIAIPARTCGTHEILGEEVQPNQNNPAGKMKEPIIMAISLSSGTTFPLFSRIFRAKRVLVMMVMVMAPPVVPKIMEMNGRAPMPPFQCRFSWKEMGNASKKR